MTPAVERTWCARCRYPGRQHFLVGTVGLAPDAPMHEVESALLAELARILPIGTPVPEIVQLLPGEIVFVPEEGT